MITPSQIKEKVLSTASHGYDIDETNAFLQQIEESFSAIYDENKELYRKMEILASKIEEYRAEEDSIKDTLLTGKDHFRGARLRRRHNQRKGRCRRGYTQRGKRKGAKRTCGCQGGRRRAVNRGKKYLSGTAFQVQR